jgi:hypothetical protein
METSTHYSTDRIDEFCEIVQDYSLRLSTVENDYSRIYEKLESCYQFIDEINVPFVFEYTKVFYQQTFDSYANQMFHIQTQIKDFPRMVETQCIIALAHNLHEHKKMCIDYLDILMSILNVSLQNLEYCVDHSIKNGLEAFESTRKIICQCR